LFQLNSIGFIQKPIPLRFLRSDYLEDIVVTQQGRGGGIGKMLFDQTMKLTLEKKCSGLVWQVLDWNEPAINFYKKYGATFDAEWVNCSLEEEQITKILNP
jgi:GNAT superfamily N-acetyltransferase